MQSLYMNDDSPELQKAWLNFRDPAAVCPHCGENWQYMGTELVSDAALHVFRHRHYPGDSATIFAPARVDRNQNGYTYARVLASPDFDSEAEQARFRDGWEREVSDRLLSEVFE